MTKIGEYLAKLKARTCLFRALSPSSKTLTQTGRDGKMHDAAYIVTDVALSVCLSAGHDLQDY